MEIRLTLKIVWIGLLCLFSGNIMGQPPHSVARQWNEALLFAIRKDFARPTIHARNLFHTSVAMYDAWAAYDDKAKPFLLGNTVGNFTSDFSGIQAPADVETARRTAISYAAYRLLVFRFQSSPGAMVSRAYFDSLFLSLGHDPDFTSSNYAGGNPAALGNYIADQVINFGWRDGSNEPANFANQYYKPVNKAMVTKHPGNPNITDPNRWQPLTLDVFIDQSGNVVPFNTPPFLSPEWGKVIPFSLNSDDLKVYNRAGGDYWVYHDPGPPPMIQADGKGSTAEYQWNFGLVSCWSGHLDKKQDVLWDISPASIGNNPELPDTFEEYQAFYQLEEGGDASRGHLINPATGQPYPPQLVPRSDYGRVLAEFWADGPESETPPGHWFTILNYVNDHPLFQRKYKGKGNELQPLEWDVKAYLALGGALHDVAITAWGIKGWYDYVRPMSAIRYMADQGQCTDNTQSNFSLSGLPLVPGFIEVVTPADTLTWAKANDIGKMKLYAWRGPDYVPNADTTAAGVGWILAENWWPYQRPSFVTPPFAGFISGHSTFSRAGAVILTQLTGDPYFPGGMSDFKAPKNKFLKFEEGPSVDVTLQWATYQDASDQCSLSRIWGGIHPPADDIPGRKIGQIIGEEAFAYAESLFGGDPTPVKRPVYENIEAKVYPNPAKIDDWIRLEFPSPSSLLEVELIDIQGRVIKGWKMDFSQMEQGFSLHEGGVLSAGNYWLRIKGDNTQAVSKLVVIK